MRCPVLRAFLFLAAASAVVGEEIPQSVAMTASSAPPPTPDQLAFRNIEQLNRSMFAAVDSALGVTKQNLRDQVPLIIGLFSGAGGRFVLYRPGQPPLEAPPVPRIYQTAKAAAHSALAAYALIAPAIKDPKANQSWVAPMRTFRTEVQTARDTLKDLDVKPAERALLEDTFDKLAAFLDTCLKNGTFTYDEVVAFARGIEPNAEKLIEISAEAQVTHWFDVLTEWKKLLGDEWGNTYAVTNSLFPTRQNNILFTIMVQFMGENAINQRLFLFETTSYQTTPEEIFGLFAHYMNDRGLSKVFFNYEDLMSHELLNGGARKIIVSESKRRGLKAFLPTLAPLNSTEWPWVVNPEKGSGPRSLEDIREAGLLPSLKE